MAFFDEILERDPKYVRAWYNKGVVLDRLGRQPRAGEDRQEEERGGPQARPG